MDSAFKCLPLEGRYLVLFRHSIHSGVLALVPTPELPFFISNILVGSDFLPPASLGAH